MPSVDKSITLIFRVGTSKLEKKLIFFMHLLALLAIALSGIDLYIRSMWIVVITASGLIHYRRYFSINKETILRYTEVFGWEIFGDNRFIRIQILESSVLTPFVICLHYVINKETQRMVIFSDALNPKDYRSLTVYLKITGPGEQIIES